MENTTTPSSTVITTEPPFEAFDFHGRCWSKECRKSNKGPGAETIARAYSVKSVIQKKGKHKGEPKANSYLTLGKCLTCQKGVSLTHGKEAKYKKLPITK